jgi:hypothetical protein
VRPHPGPPLLVLTAILAGAVAAAQNPTIRDRRVFRSGIEVTSITTTVRDGQGLLVTGLEREAFEVFEDGDPQKVTQFTNERVPISLGVVLDTSDSMFGQRIKDARAAVERFLFDLLDPGDEYFVMSFLSWSVSPFLFRRILTPSSMPLITLCQESPTNGTEKRSAALRSPCSNTRMR